MIEKDKTYTAQEAGAELRMSARALQARWRFAFITARIWRISGEMLTRCAADPLLVQKLNARAAKVTPDSVRDSERASVSGGL
jgi:hypothetical protein